MPRFATYLVAAIVAFTPISAGAVVVGQLDTFEDGTAAGWQIGGGPVGVPSTPLSNVVTGGPAGAGDNYIQITATGGSGPGSRLSAINISQWSGDYTAAGVSAIGMSLSNSGPQDLYLRLLFVELSGTGPVNVAFSTDPIFVPAGSGWIEALFPILPQDLTSPLGTAAGALLNTSELRLFHSTSPTFSPGQNEAVAATLGVDNIRAMGVPEPSTWAMMLIGFGTIGFALRRARKSILAA